MAPGLAGAIQSGVPYVLQVSESSGLANRMFRSRARAACVSFEADVDRFRTRQTVWTGYPLRAGFVPREPNIPPQRLLVMGGSQGARRLNQAVWGALDELIRRFQEVVHLTGEQGRQEGERRRRPGYRPIAFSTDVAQLMAQSDLVVSRGGVGALSEVAAVGLPAIVIPGSFGGAHQERNAAHLAARGAAVRVADAEFDSDRLVGVIDGLSAAELSAMARASRALGRPQAASAVVQVLIEVARE